MCPTKFHLPKFHLINIWAIPKEKWPGRLKENSSNTWLINLPHTGGNFQNKVDLNCSFPIFKDEVPRYSPTHYTKKCSTSPLSQYMTRWKEYCPWVTLEGQHQLSIFEGESVGNIVPIRVSFVNSEPTCCKPLSVPPPKPALTSSLTSNFWIPPPVKSAEQEGGCDKGEMDTQIIWEENVINAVYEKYLNNNNNNNFLFIYLW